jgi:hypothetical protein
MNVRGGAPASAGRRQLAPALQAAIDQARNRLALRVNAIIGGDEGAIAAAKVSATFFPMTPETGFRRRRADQGGVMIRIAITVETFDALALTLPLGSVACPENLDAKGERRVWLEPTVVDRLRFLRGPGESFSDVILRLVETESVCGLQPSSSCRHQTTCSSFAGAGRDPGE